MSDARLALACLGLALIVLAGCGSSTSPPFTLACTVHRLPSGVVRTRITVTNTTGSPAKAFVYGPALLRLRHIFPVLNPAEVVLTAGGSYRSYNGYLIPRVAPDKPFHMTMRFAPVSHARTILVSATRSVTASDLNVLANPDCTIKAHA